MSDHTLPITGGWIMVRKVPPVPIKVPLLSIFYAMPDRLFPQGWHYGHPDRIVLGRYGKAANQEQLTALWRKRQRAKYDMDQKWAVEALEEDDFELDQRVKIMHDDGSLCLEPPEWTPVSNVDGLFDCIGDGLILHQLPGMNRGNVPDQVFYLQARGIAKQEAFRLLLGEVKRPNVCWLEPEAGVAEALLG